MCVTGNALNLRIWLTQHGKNCRDNAEVTHNPECFPRQWNPNINAADCTCHQAQACLKINQKTKLLLIYPSRWLHSLLPACFRLPAPTGLVYHHITLPSVPYHSARLQRECRYGPSFKKKKKNTHTHNVSLRVGNFPRLTLQIISSEKQANQLIGQTSRQPTAAGVRRTPTRPATGAWPSDGIVQAVVR